MESDHKLREIKSLKISIKIKPSIDERMKRVSKLFGERSYKRNTIICKLLSIGLDMVEKDEKNIKEGIPKKAIEEVIELQTLLKKHGLKLKIEEV